MAARAGNWLAIVVGGSGGTLAALIGSASAPPPVSGQHMPLRPVSEIATQARTTAAVASAATTDSVAATESAAPTDSVAAADSAASTEGTTPPRTATAKSTPPLVTVAPASSAAPATSADSAELPTTPESLLHTEMHCDQGKSESCIIAARSYESGSAGQTDSEKAEKYRRIALTMWISHCDHNSAAACVTLSKMYRAGEGVPQSERNADALVARARDLCRYTDVPVCHESPVTP